MEGWIGSLTRRETMTDAERYYRAMQNYHKAELVRKEVSEALRSQELDLRAAEKTAEDRVKKELDALNKIAVELFPGLH